MQWLYCLAILGGSRINCHQVNRVCSTGACGAQAENPGAGLFILMSAPKKFRLFSLLASSFALTLLLLAHWPSARAQPAGQEAANDSPNTGASSRLKQASQKPTEERALSAIQSPSLSPSAVTPAATVRYIPSEFERFVQSQSTGVEVRRFGTELLSGS